MTNQSNRAKMESTLRTAKKSGDASPHSKALRAAQRCVLAARSALECAAIAALFLPRARFYSAHACNRPA